MTTNIHATCITQDNNGILLLGDSGSGKSDLALRLITFCQFKLVADDRVDISKVDNQLLAQAPQNLQGLLEVRGVGIVKYPFAMQTKVKLAVQLTNDSIERMPEKQFYNLEGVLIPFFKINPFEDSAAAKVLAALKVSCDDLKNGG